MKVSEILEHAKRLIDTPSKWTQGAMMRDKDHLSVHTNTAPEKIACYCSFGALHAVAVMHPGVSTQQEMKALDCLSHSVYVLDPDADGIVDFNDKPYRKHEQIMELFDKAIEYAKTKEDQWLG